MTTIQEVARRAGVSSATVSRVLNGNARVSAANRDRVRAAVAELAYRPNRVARSLRRQQTEIIGVIVSDIENPHFTQAVRAIEDAAYAEGFRVLLCNTDETPEKQREYLEMLEAERVPGVILVPADPGDPTIAHLLDHNIPIVAFDRRVGDPRADSVTADNRAAANAATRHLIDHGHTRIGFIGGLAHIQTGVERREGYRQAMQDSGLASTEASGSFRIAAAEEATGTLLAAHPDLTALVVANNLMTIGALRAVRAQGRRVPDDIGIVAIDDPAWSELVDPPITSLAQPVRQMANEAVSILIERLRGNRDGSRHETFTFELRIRQSSGGPPA